MPRRSLILTACLSLVLTIGLGAAAEELWQAVSHHREKLSIQGVGNFGRMDHRLYRGAQPSSAGFAALKALGIETIVRLSLGDEGSASEKTQVESLGMGFVNLPWSSVREPPAEQVIAFLKLMRENPDRKIFVHCKAGADRTGVMVALYRIALNHWTPDQAIDEMKAFHYRSVFLPHLQTYVEAFPLKLSEPAFVTLETAGAY